MNFLVNASPHKLLDIATSNVAVSLIKQWVPGNICVMTPRSRSNKVFSCRSVSSLTVGRINFKLYRCIGHMMKRVLGNFLCDLDTKLKVK